MAEFVELRAEEWAPELVNLANIRLFDVKEIKAVADKRKEFEYKMQRKNKTKEDYLNFIQFEVDFLRLIEFRRDKMEIHSHHAMIEGLQIARIIKLFKQVIFRHQGDIKLWMSFFKYCSEKNMLKPGSKMLVRMLQVHGDQENLWSFAAKWEYESLKSPDTARQFLLKGIRHHPKSSLLYTELFKLELNYATDKRKEMEQESVTKEDLNLKNIDDVINLKLAEVVYDNSQTKIKDVNFKVGVLNLAGEYPNTENLQDKIFQDLIKGHKEEEITWEVMARRKYNGIYFKDPDVSEQEEPMDVDAAEKPVLKTKRSKIQAAVDTYKTALKKLNTMKMWSFYLEFLFEINKTKTILVVFKRKLLRLGLAEALAAGRVEEKYFLRWTEILPQVCLKPKKQIQVLRRATELYPQSFNLWQTRLKYFLLRDKLKMGTKVFKSAILNITGAESLPLWKLMIHYLQTKSIRKVHKLFLDGIFTDGPVSLHLKPLYLHWLALTKGVGCAKAAFERPEMLHPPSVEVMNEMISLELMQPDMNKKFIRRCHEMACSLEGKTNLDVWISYIEFELQFGDGEGPFIIYMRAVKTLGADLVQEFVSKYNALKIGN